MAYNGWFNRETWVVNLHLAEVIHNYAVNFIDENDGEISIYEFAHVIEDAIVQPFIDEFLDNTSMFIQDLYTRSEINYYELAEVAMSDLDDYAAEARDSLDW